MYNMDMDRVLLNVKRFRQRPAECAIASAASLASYYDDSLTYSFLRNMVPKRTRSGGLWTSQQATLLNKAGFKKVIIVTADLDIVDFSWVDFDKDELLKKLKQIRGYYGKIKNLDAKKCIQDLITWLSNPEYNNQLKISQNFMHYIKMHLNNGKPVGASLNWTALHQFSKSNSDISGESEEHAIVIRGYDEKGIFVVDSHSEYYTGKHAKFKKGYYKISWEKYLVSAPHGDLILASRS